MILNLKVVLKGESPIALEASVTADIGRSANTSRGGPADPNRWGPVTLRRRFTPTLPKNRGKHLVQNDDSSGTEVMVGETRPASMPQLSQPRDTKVSEVSSRNEYD
jgi:hypothetical protein